ncbi:MAG TPA: T9SS type A sorting domain-containing protein, partial [Saprospiraceae bacterium]|nr:T9SS type A sorting domain-containing protein [Saprospiraceae bacterium]
TKSIQPISAAYDYFRPMVYPDEAFANYIIEFSAGDKENISADIRDSQGNVVVQQSMKAKKGVNNMHIPIAKLPEGNYIISINNGKLSHSLKILK